MGLQPTMPVDGASWGTRRLHNAFNSWTHLTRHENLLKYFFFSLHVVDTPGRVECPHHFLFSCLRFLTMGVALFVFSKGARTGSDGIIGFDFVFLLRVLNHASTLSRGDSAHRPWLRADVQYFKP